MSEFYLGSTGWEHSEWNGAYYPEDLPSEWRLSFYANEFRAVVVPFPAWASVSPAQAAQWRDDTPERFRFFLQLPVTHGPPLEELIPAARQTGKILGGRLGGFIGDISAGRISRSTLDRLGRLSGQWPVALLADGPPGPELREQAGRAAISVCWEEGGLPRAAGRFTVLACPKDAAPRTLRAVIEGLAAAAGPEGIGLLIFPGETWSVSLMRAGNTIAELLGL